MWRTFPGSMPRRSGSSVAVRMPEPDHLPSRVQSPTSVSSSITERMNLIGSLSGHGTGTGQSKCMWNMPKPTVISPPIGGDPELAILSDRSRLEVNQQQTILGAGVVAEARNGG